MTFGSSAVKLVCDSGFAPNVMLGPHDQTFFWMSRSTYSDISKPIQIGIEDSKLNRMMMTTAGVLSFALASSDDINKNSLSIMPLVGLTCIKDNIR